MRITRVVVDDRPHVTGVVASMITTLFSMYRPPNRVGFAKFQPRSAEISVESSLAAGECDFTDRLAPSVSRCRKTWDFRKVEQG
jgi:hypothetical protein